MAYRSEIESRLAKRTTKAIADYQMIEDGDRVMVGLSGGKDSWALLQMLDVLRQRAPIRFSLVAVNVDSGYKDYKHDVIARTCEARGWEYRIEHTGIGEIIEDILDADADAVLAVRAAAARRALPDRERGRRDEDRARPPRRRLHRDAAAQPVLRRRAQGDAGQARAPTTARTWSSGRSSTSAKTRRARMRRSASCRSSAAAVRRAATSSLQRQRIKRLLMDLEREHPGVKQSMLKALGNVAPRHLLDRRLNPPADLRAEVGRSLRWHRRCDCVPF